MRNPLWEWLEALDEAKLKKVYWNGQDSPDQTANVIVVEKTVTKIPANAFANFTNLQQCIMYSGLREIGENAFAGCTNLTELVIPETVQDIGNNAFGGAGLKKIQIPANIAKTLSVEDPNNLNDNSEKPEKVISDTGYTKGWGVDKKEDPKLKWRGAMSLGIDLSKTYVSVTGMTWINSKDSQETQDVTTGIETNKDTTLKIPADMKVITAEYMRRYCAYIVALYIPATVIKIEEGAFANFRHLQLVVWEDKLQNVDIGRGIFANCEVLPEIVLPKGIKVLPPQMFMGCKSLKKVTVPIAIQKMDPSVFEGCPTNMTLFLPNVSIAPSKNTMRQRRAANPNKIANINTAQAVYNKYFNEHTGWTCIHSKKAEGYIIYQRSGSLVNMQDKNKVKEDYTVMNVKGLNECFESLIKERLYSRDDFEPDFGEEETDFAVNPDAAKKYPDVFSRSFGDDWENDDVDPTTDSSIAGKILGSPVVNGINVSELAYGKDAPNHAYKIAPEVKEEIIKHNKPILDKVNDFSLNMDPEEKARITANMRHAGQERDDESLEETLEEGKRQSTKSEEEIEAARADLSAKLRTRMTELKAQGKDAMPIEDLYKYIKEYEDQSGEHTFFKDETDAHNFYVEYQADGDVDDDAIDEGLLTDIVHNYCDDEHVPYPEDFEYEVCEKEYDPDYDCTTFTVEIYPEGRTSNENLNEDSEEMVAMVPEEQNN